MKRILGLLVILAMLLGIMGCADSGKKKLFIYNWSYYIPEEVLKEFEKRFNVELVYDVFSSNEEMYAKLKAGGKGYDVVFPSIDYAEIMKKEGMLLQLDKAKIPNIQYLDKDITVKIKFDPNSDFSVPFMMGAAGIAVNTKYVSNYPRNYHIYEMTSLAGRMTLLDEIREVIGNALIASGYSANSVNPEELQKAKELILKWKKNIQKFDSESFGKGFASGEFWVVNGYGENVFLEADDELKENIDFFIPDMGSTMYIDNMVILKDSKNVDLALDFINFIHEPEIYAQIVDFLTLPSVNVEARKHIKEEPLYKPEDLKKCELQEDLGENLELYNKLWQEIRMDN